MEGKVIIISAPSGAGKTSIVKYLIDNKLPLSFSVSAASRAKRENEINGRDYHFISVEEFKAKIANNDFLEWEEVYPNQFYGSLKSEIERIWATGRHVLFDVDVVGGVNIKKFYGEKALSIFVKPPTKEILVERLQNRGTETPESLQKRLNKAEYELSFENQFDVVIVNDNLQVAQNEALTLISDFLK